MDRKKLQHIFYACIISLFFILMAGILILLFGFQHQVDYLCKKEFILSNPIILLLIIFVTFLCMFIFKNKAQYTAVYDPNARFPKSAVRWASFFLFLIQLYICYNIFFETLWDSGQIVDNARMISNSQYENLANNYFSMYPNNVFIVWLYSIIFKINSSIGIFTAADDLMAIITVQCFLSSFTGYLLWLCARNLFENDRTAWFTWIIYVALIGISPWMSIPYSDACGLIFPTAAFYLYLTIGEVEQGIKRYVRWGGIGLLAFWGYQLKPQLVIVFIAIIIIELLKCIPGEVSKEGLKRFIYTAAAIMAVFLVSTGISHSIKKATGILIDKDGQFTLTHFAMMGLNYDTDGTFYDMDVYYSESFPNVAERQAGNLKVIKERLAEYGFTKVMSHTARKLLVTYGDGTFAWGNEGNFYYKLKDDKNTIVSPFLKSIYYNNGKNFRLFSSILQIIWIFILAGTTGIIFIIKKNIQKKEKILVLALSIIGLTIFEILFEARARYLYTYIPFYIVLAVFGWNNYLKYFLLKWRTKENRMER